METTAMIFGAVELRRSRRTAINCEALKRKSIFVVDKYERTLGPMMSGGAANKTTSKHQIGGKPQITLRLLPTGKLIKIS